MIVDPLVSLLVGALGAATLTVTGGLVGAIVQHRREHTRWLREQRLSAYLDFLRLADRITTMPRLASEDGIKFLNDLQTATASLRLLGPKSVLGAAVEFTGAAMRYSNMTRGRGADGDARPKAGHAMVEARQTLVAAAQKELGIRA